METDPVEKAEGESPFEGSRNLSRLVGRKKRFVLSLGTMLVSAWEGGWATLRRAPAPDDLVLNPYFGRRQFSGKRGRDPGQPGEVERERREGGGSESGFEFMRQKMLRCSRRLD